MRCAMKIRNRLNPSRPCFSFEFFPPKTAAGVEKLLRTLDDLAPLEPGFVSVTYGAGGSSRDATVELVERIKGSTGIETMAHLTCVGHTREEVGALLERLAAAGHREPAGPARRSAGGTGGLRAPAGRLPLRDGAGGVHRRAGTPLLPGRRGLSRGARGDALPRGRPPAPQGQGRRGAGLRHHPALLRQRLLLRLRGALPTGGDQRPHRPGHHAHHQLRAAPALRPPLRRDGAHAAPAPAGAGAGRPGGAHAARRGPRDGAVHGAAPPRRAGDPLLHAEQEPGDADDRGRAQGAVRRSGHGSASADRGVQFSRTAESAGGVDACRPPGGAPSGHEAIRARSPRTLSMRGLARLRGTVSLRSATARAPA